MSEQFYTILTKQGKAKIANATALGDKVNLSKFKVGDGGGSYYNPSEDQTKLRNKVWEGNISSITVDKSNPNWIVLEVIIPHDVGGFMIREAGVFDDNGNLMAIGKYPETYKPVVADGSTKDLIIKMILEVSNTSSVTLKVDPTVILATQKDILMLDNKIGTIKIPVTSVNNKTGSIELKAADIKAKDGTTLEEFKQNATTQYEDLVQDIKENATKSITKEANVLSLSNSISGIANIEIGGNTVLNIFKSPNKFNQYSNTNLFYTTGKINLKTNTTYSQILLGWRNGILQYGGHTGGADEEWTAPYVNSPCSVFKTPNKIKSNSWTPHIKSETISVEDMKKHVNNNNFKIMILEGDWSKKIPKWYFEGIQTVSSLEDNKLQITSCHKNLFEPSNLKCMYENNNGGLGKLEYFDNGIKLYGKAHYYKMINVKPYTDYVLSCNKQNTNPSGVIWIGDAGCSYGITQWRYESTMKFNTGCRTTIMISFIYWDNDKSKNTYFKNIQLEEGTKATSYEAYAEDKVSYKLKTPLRGLPNSTRDSINGNGITIRRVGKTVLNGSEDWKLADRQNTIMFILRDFAKPNGSEINNLICSNFTNKVIYSVDEEGIYSSVSGNLYVRILKSKLKTQDINGFKKWLSENPTTIIYELKEPIIQNTGQPLTLKTFENGSIQVNTNIPPLLTVKYSSNLNSRINNLEEASSIIKSNLGGAWRTLLILADKELKMKTITPLTTKDVISNKINEMIGAWR